MAQIENDLDKDQTPWQGDYRDLSIDDFIPDAKKSEHTFPISQRPPRESLLAAFYMSLLIVFISVLNWLGNGTHSLAISYASVIEDSQYWRLWTAFFIHSDFGHITSNLWIFSIFGYLLHNFWGGWIFPSLTFGVMGSLTNLLTVFWYKNSTFILGASGMVYGMIGLWLVTYCFFERRYSVATRIFRSTGFTLVVLFPSTIAKNISYSSHFFGFLVGVAAGMILCFLYNKKKNNALLAN